jgi:hypothetical protein
MSHMVFKRCPYCGRNHGTFISLSLELDSGGIDESSDIYLNDPFELAEYYSLNGLEKLVEEAGNLEWFCGRRQVTYRLGSMPSVGSGTKLDLAGWLGGLAVRVQGVFWRSLWAS